MKEFMSDKSYSDMMKKDIIVSDALYKKVCEIIRTKTKMKVRPALGDIIHKSFEDFIKRYGG